MTRLEILRRHALAHTRTARRLDRLYPHDDALRAVLNDASALVGHLMAAGHIDRDALDRLVGAVTDDEAPGATEGDVMTVRMVAEHG